MIKHNEVWVGYHVDNLKFCEFSNRLYTAGISSMWKFVKEINTPESAFAEHPGLWSIITEIGVPEYGMGIRRNLVVTDKLTPLSTGVRVGKYLLGGSPIADGIIVCKIDEKIE